MAEERIERGQNPETEFEKRDLSAKGILSFLLGLAVFGVIIHYVLTGMYDVMDRYDQRHQPPMSPLATQVEKQKTQNLAELRAKFPEPRLEVNERTELQGVVMTQEQQLNSYGWVDEKAGIVRIPIQRAMQLIAQKGLPTREQGNGAVQALSGKGQKNKLSGQAAVQGTKAR